MPEMLFKIRWPDGTTEDCYSPSLVIKDHLETGRAYPLAEFRALSRTALSIASERVRAKYGFPCSNALLQIARIDAACRRFEGSPDASVGILSFQE